MKRFLLISTAAVVLATAAAVPFGLKGSHQNSIAISPEINNTAISETYESLAGYPDSEAAENTLEQIVSEKENKNTLSESAGTEPSEKPSIAQINKNEPTQATHKTESSASKNEKEETTAVSAQKGTQPPANGATNPKTTLPPATEASKTNPKPTAAQPATQVTKPNTTEPAEQKTYAEQVVDLVNQERKKAGLQPLSVNSSAAAAAQIRAKEIEKSFSHTRPDGSSFSTALTEQGIRYRTSGENIAWGQKTPRQVVDGWMNSAGHRANILNEKFTSIGVGYYKSASGVNYWTQLFIG